MTSSSAVTTRKMTTMNEINKDRTGFIGGSDAARIVAGEWLDLWLEKTGRKEPEDLSGVFQVQLGSFTEGFHLDWLRDHHGWEISVDTKHWQHPEFSWMRAQIDGWREDGGSFIEVKHTNERSTLDIMVQRYLPQLAHYCMVTNQEFCWFSFIPGNQPPVFVKVNIPAEYIEKLKLAEIEFWWHVTNDTEPATAPALAMPTDNVLIDDMRTVDMSGNNEWAYNATKLIETKAAADMHEQAKKGIKELVEPDVREASGHGVTIKRDKRGSLRLTISKE